MPLELGWSLIRALVAVLASFVLVVTLLTPFGAAVADEGQAPPAVVPPLVSEPLETPISTKLPGKEHS
ncbi:hypothetical protein PYV02_08365 [Leifsonia sp. H3M29-4]|uniref:hypothetical protein n=1 Tax=Salinibacterium metalliresistens TaxID=3031321 RepID=UPI0023D9BFA8|nr:hypothetical protein [Salinibacterium metalliresistens]MDF1479092.1 hypothetical protein [Salinibacterium metalliresistens]